jgi:glycosyltransferase involved in cell wall biosynthesis
MLQTPRITALINTYNYGRFVGEAIESVLGQDVAPGEMEVLVVDDGSTDDTAAVVAQFGERVRYLYKPNGGQGSALNLGFAQARGEFVAFLDGDDLWLPGKVRRVLEEFERHPDACMAYHRFLCWNPATNQTWSDNFFSGISGNVPARREDLLRFGGPSTSGVTVRRAMVQSLFPIPEEVRLIADYYLAYLAIFLGPVVAVNEALAKFRDHGNNLYSFDSADRQRLERRWRYLDLVTNEWERWLERQGFDIKRPEIEAYVRRSRLSAEKIRFACRGATRRELFSHLQQERNVFGPLWTPRYRLFKLMMAYVGLVAGYSTLESMRALYRRAQPLQRLRERLLPSRAESKEKG